jgi:putative addiction module killer protein
MPMILIRDYLDATGRSPHAAWRASLPREADARVAAVLYRMANGNFSNVKGLGGGVFERKIEFGPGLRVYFGRDAGALIVVLGGSTKQRQSEAIALAQQRWDDYRRRKGRADPHRRR